MAEPLYVTLEGSRRPSKVARLQPMPENVVGFRVMVMYVGGAAVPKSSLHQTGGSRGLLAVDGDYSSALQRQTLCAELRNYQISTFPERRLVDCRIEWMSNESFGLGGLSIKSAYQGQPEALERGGWLCDIDVTQQALTKAEYRMLR